MVSAAFGALGSAAQTLGGIAASSYNNEQLHNLTAQDRELNYKYNEKSAENADIRQRMLYHDLYSPKAQLQQIKEAGLSPSLMYGGAGGGGGGATPHGAQGNGANGLQTGYSPIQGLNALDAAQIGLITAETQKTKAETQNTEEQTISNKLQNFITSSNMGETLKQAQLQTQTMAAELQQTISTTKGIEWKNNFNEITQNEQVQALVNKNSETLSRIVLNESQAKLNDRQREHFDTIFDKWQMDIYQKFVELDIAQQNADTQEEWFEQQAILLRDRLDWEKEKYPQDLRVQKTSMWLNFGTDVLKTAVYGTGLIMSRGGLQVLSNLGNPPKQPIGFK